MGAEAALPPSVLPTGDSEAASKTRIRARRNAALGDGRGHIATAGTGAPAHVAPTWLRTARKEGLRHVQEHTDTGDVMVHLGYQGVD